MLHTFLEKRVHGSANAGKDSLEMAEFVMMLTSAKRIDVRRMHSVKMSMDTLNVNA